MGRYSIKREFLWIIFNPSIRRAWINTYHNGIYAFTSEEKAKNYLIREKVTRKENLSDAILLKVDRDILYDSYAHEIDYILIDAQGGDDSDEVEIMLLEKSDFQCLDN